MAAMKRAGFILAITAMLAACAGDPEQAALTRRDRQLRERPTLLNVSRPAEMPKGRGPLAEPPSRAPAPPPRPKVASISSRNGPGDEPGRGYNMGQFLFDALAVGSAAYLSTTTPNACPAD